MKKPARHIMANLLIVIFLAITVSPLSSLLTRSTVIAHALSGECSGDCDICGCSPERRASHTCCCWQKKLNQHNHDEQSDDVADCCKKEQQANRQTAISCNCPCDSGKQLAFSGMLTYELLPFQSAELTLFLASEYMPNTHPRRMTTRHIEPPDPPPKVLIYS